jgi:hypothetical protein
MEKQVENQRRALACHASSDERSAASVAVNVGYLTDKIAVGLNQNTAPLPGVLYFNTKLRRYLARPRGVRPSFET